MAEIDGHDSPERNGTGMVLQPRTTPLGVAAALTLALSTAACVDIFDSGETITASGQLTTETYELADFSEVEASDAFDVEITNGEPYAVEVTVDDNIVESLDVDRSGDTLRIGLKGHNSYRDPTLRARVTMPALERIKLSGASSAATAGFGSDGDLDVDLSGASSLRCDDMAPSGATLRLQGASSLDCRDLRTGDISADLAGASKVDLTGSGSRADLKAQGASNISMVDLPVTDAKVQLSGASKATVNVTGSLDVDLSGSSDLFYSGEPRLGETKTAGDSNMERR